MTSIVPGRPPHAVTLADVLPAVVSSLAGADNPLRLPPAVSAIVLLVDGLGSSALGARKGHARTLAAAPGGSIWSGFPTTTAAALTTLMTGVLPGEHGLVGYSVLDADRDRVVKQLSGWDSGMRPDVWQRSSTVFERAADAGVTSFAVGPRRYAASGLTEAILSGATYVSAESMGDRFDRARDLAESTRASLVYLYVPELDMIAHRAGWESPEWTTALEELDAEIRRLGDGLGAGTGLLVTADHGILDVGERRRIVFGDRPELVDGVRHVAGEPRCLQLHFEPDASEERRAATLAAWRDAESERAWVVTREQAVEADWFGPVHPDVLPRIGDVLVAARRGVVYYDGRTTGGVAGSMIGQHGSWSSDETQVPLRRLAAYAR
ncbi:MULTISPECIES: alkaline phosphatase family protein [unclassified Frigoribacterium]|uniref:alkaline phosphatase family protein n=1 Tax=unclassified Frigoribacterium TaxID=2627005 RepID=UPI0006F46406|nr:MULTISPECIES: alkaline phosphatase family protein [unclassified Frigoribacterium]KQO82800.1 hypothetical protein ASF17_07200 [Frigoribacterium sp. Leaf263]KQR64502.1 hypothetical protein ASF89_08350 [Frigoribacterium sp. Leaf172]